LVGLFEALVVYYFRGSGGGGNFSWCILDDLKFAAVRSSFSLLDLFLLLLDWSWFTFSFNLIFFFDFDF